MNKGIIFDIKRYAIHDGPGIRTTVFFKGCPLGCPWCHNPEGKNPELEITWNSKKCPKECTACLPICPQDAIKKQGRSIIIDHSKCDLCGKCRDVCAYEALEIVGEEVTVKHVMEEVEKDRIFFENSGGGVTFSGGEPLMQPDFLEAILDECRKRNVQTTIDTSGYASSEILERISNKVDLFLYDIKLIDEKKHKEHIGASNKIILQNLIKLSKKGKKIFIRIPLVAGVNDDEKNIRKTAEFLLSLKSLRQITLLPYHKGGVEKYKRLRRENSPASFMPSSYERTKKIKKILENYGFFVKAGG